MEDGAEEKCAQAHNQLLSKPNEGQVAPISLHIRSKLWQIVPIFCGSLLNVPFGLMLGWPSPTYPKLLDTANSTTITDPSIIPITLDQSAMVAGFLMLGIVVTTPIATWRLCGTKYGQMVGTLTMLFGWTVMWQARNIYWLLLGRFAVGGGQAFAIGQLRHYITMMAADQKMAAICLKWLNAYVFVGIVVANTFQWFDVETFAFICVLYTAFIFVLQMFLPHPPAEYVRFNRISKAKRLIRFIYPLLDTNQIEVKINRFAMEASNNNESIEWNQRAHNANENNWRGVLALLKGREYRKKLFKLLALTFFQQFTGLPPIIVYTQIILMRSKTITRDEAQLFPIFITLGLLFAHIFAIVHMVERFKSKTGLLLSTMGITITLTLLNLCLYFEFTQPFPYTFVTLLFTFVCFNAIGLAIIPPNYIQMWFPKENVNGIKCLTTMIYCALAIIATKMFQVLMGNFGLLIAFIKCTTLSLLSLIFVCVYL